ncbi:replication initiation protein [Pseudomonas sp. 2FE]|uniref:replication initiation protein n=1 Tax=Pseudomonas sp. 2FE TaxID=2502190 RepID=UPI0010F61B08|nr:replication initiation protein [Pseudomonas sp. 2FE]
MERKEKAGEASIKVTKHNNLITASYSLSLAEQRLVLAAIARIDPRKPMPKSIVIDSSSYARIYGIELRHAYEQLSDACKKLWDAEIISITGTGKGEAIKKVRWVDSATYLKGFGQVELSFSQKVKPYLSLLYSKVTSYELWRIARLDSSYSFRMFEMLMQFRSTGWMQVDVEDLRTRLGLGDGYQRFNNLRQKIIDPALAELREKSGLEVEYELKRSGRTVVSILFKFSDSPKLSDLRKSLWPQTAEDALGIELDESGGADETPPAFAEDDVDELPLLEEEALEPGNLDLFSSQ